MVAICGSLSYLNFFIILALLFLLGLPEILSFWTYLHRNPASSCFRSASCSHLVSLHLKVLITILTAVHVIRIHAIYDKNRLILLGMTALFAVQVVVTAICCAFFRCSSEFLCSLMVLLTLLLYSRPPPWRPKVYRRSETKLGGYLLGSPHPPLHRFGRYTLASMSHFILNYYYCWAVRPRCHAFGRITSNTTSSIKTSSY